jgi:hypothetical protein
VSLYRICRTEQAHIYPFENMCAPAFPIDS